jgi:hypothetical protein
VLITCSLRTSRKVMIILGTDTEIHADNLFVNWQYFMSIQAQAHKAVLLTILRSRCFSRSALGKLEQPRRRDGDGAADNVVSKQPYVDYPNGLASIFNVSPPDCVHAHSWGKSSIACSSRALRFSVSTYIVARRPGCLLAWVRLWENSQWEETKKHSNVHLTPSILCQRNSLSTTIHMDSHFYAHPKANLLTSIA